METAANGGGLGGLLPAAVYRRRVVQLNLSYSLRVCRRNDPSLAQHGPEQVDVRAADGQVSPNGAAVGGTETQPPAVLIIDASSLVKLTVNAVSSWP